VLYAPQYTLRQQRLLVLRHLHVLSVLQSLWQQRAPQVPTLPRTQMLLLLQLQALLLLPLASPATRIPSICLALADQDAAPPLQDQVAHSLSLPCRCMCNPLTEQLPGACLAPLDLGMQD
jgi:hypothetical protein